MPDFLRRLIRRRKEAVKGDAGSNKNKRRGKPSLWWWRRRRDGSGRDSDSDQIRTVKVGKANWKGYPSNRIVTSKYTLWNFIPKNLYEQLRRIANFYFLCIGIVSFIVESPVGPLTSLLPLTFVVLVTAVKQGYEDYVRHRADRDINSAAVWVLRDSCLQKIPSQKIKVGDIVKVRENEDVPCDLVLLTSSHESSKCYVTTSSLDGETNLKTLYCPKSLKRNIRTENLGYLDATIECQTPTPDLYKFNGRIEFSKMTSDIIKRNSLRRQTSAMAHGEGDDAGPRPDSGTGDFLTPFPPAFVPTVVRESTNNICAVPGPIHGSVPSEETPSMAGFATPLRKSVDHEASELKRHMTLPMRALPRHKKSFSNVKTIDFDPSFFDSLDVKWVTKRRGSERQNLVDPLTSENLLLRGSTLRNTEFVYGCAVYTGQETKMALNSSVTRNKFSVAEKSINKFLTFQLGILIVESVASTILNATVEIKHGRKMLRSIFFHNEDEEDERGTFTSVFKDLFLFVMAYNYLLPISLYVTLEMTKFLGTLLFKWDLFMYDPGTDQAALANTSDLNEELGEVEYLFTDKTGTLTENNLRFHSCSIGGVPYEERDGLLHIIDRNGALADFPTKIDFEDCSTETRLFLLALTLCNTVQVIVGNRDGGLRYNATSPDEKAFVEAMERFNIVFANDDDFVLINVGGRNRIFQKLEVLEFSSNRKRMSVIVKDEDEEIRLYCKGAETAVIPKVVAGPIEVTLEHVSNFANKGLRTLVVGYKILTEEEYRDIEEKVQTARETLSSNREEIVSKTYEEIENGLTLLGATGVEDKLQDGVADTLHCLRAAGIKVWILTGDKVETAVNISISCGHFKYGMKRLYLTGMKSADECEDTLLDFQSTVAEEVGEEFGVIVDGTSLQFAIERCSDLFRDVCLKCSAVVCCRLSPMQKSQIVQVVKTRKNAPIVAAIGDGANDVSMIQEAHVGLGIMGKEGRQAVLCSDFAFARFRFLKRALLVHGHWYYLRTANLVQYFFYKNIVFITPQFYFFFFSGFSVQQLYESMFYVCYNTIFTSLPVLLYGALEQNYPDEKLLRTPSLYKIHRRNVLMTWKFFALWLILGIWHSLVVFFAPTFFYYTNSTSAVSQGCLENYGTIILHNAVTVVNLKLLLHSRYWTAPFLTSIFLSVFVMYVITIVYSSLNIPDTNLSYYWTFNHLIQDGNYWLLCLVTWVAALVPDVIVSVFLSMRVTETDYAPLAKTPSTTPTRSETPIEESSL